MRIDRITKITTNEPETRLYFDPAPWYVFYLYSFYLFFFTDHYFSFMMCPFLMYIINKTIVMSLVPHV